MRKIMFYSAAISAAITTFAVIGHVFLPVSFFDSIAITAGTIFFHLVMRLFVGTVLSSVCRSRTLCNSKWFQVRTKETHIYKQLKVRKWKKYVPTYDPDEFSTGKHSLEEIMQATCVSELVHETIIALSFLPLVFSISFGAFPVFLITSVLAAGIDSIFVILQRYNRPRIANAIEKHAICRN